MGEFSPPFFSEPPSFFLFLIPQTPQPRFGFITLLQKFTPHFKILDPRLSCTLELAYFAGKIAKNRLVCIKMPLHWLIMGVVGSL